MSYPGGIRGCCVYGSVVEGVRVGVGVEIDCILGLGLGLGLELGGGKEGGRGGEPGLGLRQFRACAFPWSLDPTQAHPYK